MAALRQFAATTAMKIQTLAASFALFGCLSVAVAQADAAASKLDSVRNLYNEYVKVREDVTKENGKLMEEMRGMKRGSDEQKAAVAKMTELRNKQMGPQKAFSEAFAACDWTKLDPKADAALLKDALPGVVRDLEHPEKAIAAGKLFLQHFDGERAADGIRGNALPMAFLASGNSAEAMKLYEAAVAAANGPAKARALLNLGDMLAASGDAAGAAAKYAEADGAADDNTKRYVTLRKELIGKPAPDIDSKTWIGGDAKPLSSLKGKVVLVDFWATWCAPCRAIAPTLDELAAQYQGRVKVAKIDVDAEQQIAQQFGIRSIPTLLVFKGGQVVEQLVGAVPKSRLEAAITKAL